MEIVLTHSKETKIKGLCDLIFQSKLELYVLGTNIWAQDLIEKINTIIKVNYVIDEFNNKKLFKGIKVVKCLSEINKNKSIVITCILGKPWTIKKKLDFLEIINIDYFSFWKFSGLNLIDLRNWNEFQKEFNEKVYSEIFKTLNDIESQRTLQNIINFRLTQDLNHLKYFSDNQQYQYFEPFLDLSHETFIDIGGYDGYTSKQFFIETSNDNNVIFFEPDKINIEQAKNNLLSQKSKVTFYCCGLGDVETISSFSIDGSKSKVSHNGEISIEIKTIDSLILKTFKEGKFYMKMDIEGWEFKALKGSRQFIIENKPKMAICVYHKPNDIVEIFNYVLSLNPEYKVYLRHYTEGVDETVMYFI